MSRMMSEEAKRVKIGTLRREDLKRLNEMVHDGTLQGTWIYGISETFVQGTYLSITTSKPINVYSSTQIIINCSSLLSC